MSGLRRKEEEIGLVDLDKDISDKTNDGLSTETVKKINRKAGRMAMAGILAGSLVLIFLSTWLLQIPLVTVGFVIVIEAVMVAALNHAKLWVHIAVMALEIMMGFLFEYALFLILAAAFYFVLLIALKLLEL